jgi:hypothetical protein
MMHLIYSALRNPSGKGKNKDQKPELTKEQEKAYKELCKKYENEIEAIQQYFPNWKPARF